MRRWLSSDAPVLSEMEHWSSERAELKAGRESSMFRTLLVVIGREWSQAVSIDSVPDDREGGQRGRSSCRWRAVCRKVPGVVELLDASDGFVGG